MKQHTRARYEEEHLHNDYVETPLGFDAWCRAMREYDQITHKLDRMLANPRWNEDAYWRLEQKCSDVCKLLGY